ncbi:MAG: hypothetical protein SPL29_06630 [Bacteroidales bacterium]|nr:hypothetical protein [Bacteroidales bacterium]
MELEKRYTKEEFTRIYNANSVTDLAKKLGYSRQTIIAMAKKYGLPHKKNGGDVRKHKTIKISVKELEELYRKTRTIDLAKRFNVSVATLVKILKQHGIEMKKPGWGTRERKLVVEE